MTNSIMNRCLLFVLLFGLLSPLLAQQAGEAVRIQGTIAEDVYAAGGTVDVLATVNGDVVVAGGRVTVSERISGDLMAAGGSVNVRANIEDDMRLAGGDVVISGTIGGDAIAAGGNVTLSSDSKVGGRAWLGGGRIDVAGTVGKELKAAGGRIVISGQVNGNVELRGDDITILESAIINGDLLYHSSHEAKIANRAQVHGTIQYEPIERPVKKVVAAIVGVGIVVLLSLIITGIALFLLFPHLIGKAMTALRAEFWKCLGLGLAVFAATPVVISLLFMTVIGWLPALIIGALYLILLLAGYLTAAFFIGDLGLRLLRRSEVSRAWRLWSFVFASILLVLLCLIPLIGQLLFFILTLLGVGVLALEIYRGYKQAN